MARLSCFRLCSLHVSFFGMMYISDPLVRLSCDKDFDDWSLRCFSGFGVLVVYKKLCRVTWSVGYHALEDGRSEEFGVINRF